MKDRPVFCRGCPRMPEGVAVEIQAVELMSRESLRRDGVSISPEGRRLILESTGLDSASSGFGAVETLIARVEGEVVEVSGKASSEIGDSGELYILAGAITGAEIVQLVQECHGPRLNRTDRLLGRRGECPAINSGSVLTTSD